MKPSKTQVALYGLLQNFGQTTDNEYVEYLHYDGAKHTMPWEDVIETVEYAVSQLNQEDRAQLKAAEHGLRYGLGKAQLQMQMLARSRPWHVSNYNGCEPETIEFDETQIVQLGNRIGMVTLKATAQLQRDQIQKLNHTVAGYVRRQEAALQHLRPLYLRMKQTEVKDVIGILEAKEDES